MVGAAGVGIDRSDLLDSIGTAETLRGQDTNLTSAVGLGSKIKPWQKLDTSSYFLPLLRANKSPQTLLN